MRKYYLLLAVLLLTSCSNNYRVRNIISFTNLLKSEENHSPVIIPHKQSMYSEDFGNINIAVDNLPEKISFGKLKITSPISASPLIIKDKVIVLTLDGQVTAFQTDNLSKLWSINMIGKKSSMNSFGGGIAHHEGKLYVTNGSQMLDIIDLETGRRIISKKFPDVIIAAPLVKDDLILLLTLGNQLYALNKYTHAIIWDHAGSPETLTYGKMSFVSIDNKFRVFVSYSSGQLYLLNPKDGLVLWHHDLSAGSHMPGLLPTNVTAKPILEGDNIYLADSNGSFYKFDTSKGTILWKKPIQDILTINSVGNTIFITTNARQAAAINKDDGKIIWVTDLVDDLKAVNKAIAAYEEEKREKEQFVKASNPGFFSRFKEAIKPKEKTATKQYTYDRSKLNPIDIIYGAVVNDVYTLFTSKGEIYFISPENGKILDQKHLNASLSFVNILDKIILTSGKKIFMGKL